MRRSCVPRSKREVSAHEYQISSLIKAIKASSHIKQISDLGVATKDNLEYALPADGSRLASLMDEVGLDVCEHVASFFGEQFGDRMPVPPLLKTMVEEQQFSQR